MALQHPLHVHLPLPRCHRHRLPALQVPHPRPHTTGPAHAEAVDPNKRVWLRWREDIVRLQPAPLHQPLTHTFLPCYRPHCGFSCPPGHRLPQPPGGPSPGPTGRVRLREHLAALPATEPALEQHHPYFLPPELRVPLPLDMPLVNLPRG